MGLLLLRRAAALDLSSLPRRLGLPALLLGGFAAMCLAGTGLLSLPVATPEHTSQHHKVLWFVDALFTSVSATCGVGLTNRDTGLHFTPFGQAVLLALIQAGGLGVMIFGTLLIRHAARGPAARGESLPLAQSGGAAGPFDEIAAGPLVRRIVVWTLLIEAAGAAMLYPMFAAVPDGADRPQSLASAAWQSVFHSVSAFCNSGFSLYGRNLTAGVGESQLSEWGQPLRDHWQVLGVMAPLIVLGGVGLPVLADCGACLRAAAGWAGRRLRRRDDLTSVPSPSPRLSPHSRIVLWMTAVLILVGAAGLLAVEPRPGKPAPSQERQPLGGGNSRLGDWADPNMPHRLQATVFLSISARTAGFNTVDLRELSDAGKLWLCGLMLVGGSPGGTAGGMKTVTAFLLVAAVASCLRRRPETHIFDRPVSPRLIEKALTAAVLYLALVALTALGLSVLMRPGYSFLDILFESCSACGAAGLSTGLTPSLNDEAKYLLLAAMFAGRLGVLSLFLALAGRPRASGQTHPSHDPLAIA
jgi:trk system potassium uptake protein TrkH